MRRPRCARSRTWSTPSCVDCETARDPELERQVNDDEQNDAVAKRSNAGRFHTRERALSRDKLRRVFMAIPTNDDDGHRFVPTNLGQALRVRERFDRGVLGSYLVR